MRDGSGRSHVRAGLTAFGIGALLATGVQTVGLAPAAAADQSVGQTVGQTVGQALPDPSGTVDPPAATPPSAPSGVSAEPGDGAATVRWTPPSDTFGITGFLVTATPGGASTSAAAGSTSAVVPGLSNGTSYSFAVQARSDAGPSQASTTDPVTPYGPPRAPTGLTLTAGDGTITASWTAAVPNGRTVAGYRIDLASPSGNSSLSVPASASSGTVSGLVDGATYTVTVTTIDSGSAEAAGSAATAVPGRAPTAPGSVRVVPGTTTVNGSPSAVVSWTPATAGGPPITGYQVTSSAGTAPVTVAPQSGSATVPATVGRSTVFTVTALSSSGSTAASAAPFTLGAIDGWYAVVGGPASYLGAPVAGEGPVGPGRMRRYAGGSIYWSPATGAHAVHGAILARYLQLGGPTSTIGFPTGDEAAAGTGRRNSFVGSDLYWSSTTGTREIHGAIRTLYNSLGGAAFVIGLPTTDETTTPDRVGRYNHFQSGSIYWTPGTGAHEVHGAIRDRWSAGGWELGMLGYPVSNEYAVPGGRRSDFQFGYVTWTSGAGARQVVTRGDRLVAMARTHLGARYVYGAAGPTTFDCSGLVQYVHRQLGMSIPRTTWLQAPASRPIAKSAAQPGDVIFLLDGSHEGIYVGNGQMIDAPHSGTVVKQRAIWTSSYSVGRFW